MLESENFETSKYWLPLVASGVGFFLLLFCSTFYFFSRPCVIFECTEISRAEKIVRSSQTILQQSRSTKNLILAYEDLEQAIALLDSIPVWSDRYLQTQNTLAIYRKRQANLKKLVTVFQLRDRAISLAKNPPFSVTRWQEIKAIWIEAIATLELIPKQSEYYSFARQKNHQYREKLVAINEAIAREKKALELFQAARERADFANKSQNNANDFTEWQLVYSHWQAAVRFLDKIPDGTTVTAEAKQFKISLLPELKLSQKRRELEETALNNHNRAIATAKLAKEAEKERDWAKALAYWQDSLNYLKAVPENTFQYRKTQQLIAPYLYALNISQRQRNFILRLERAAIDLDKICSSQMKICDFTIKNDGIKVRLTGDYIEQVQQTALQTGEQKKLQDRVRVMDHIFSLERGFKTIVNNSQMGLELYNNEEVLLLTYLPDL